MVQLTQRTSEPGPKTLLWVLFLLTPTLVALGASAALARQSPSVSALWFLYETSRLFGYMGIVVAAFLTLRLTSRHVVSRRLSLLVIASIACTALILWYAASLVKNLP